MKYLRGFGITPEIEFTGDCSKQFEHIHKYERLVTKYIKKQTSLTSFIDDSPYNIHLGEYTVVITNVQILDGDNNKRGAVVFEVSIITNNQEFLKSFLKFLRSIGLNTGSEDAYTMLESD